MPARAPDGTILKGTVVRNRAAAEFCRDAGLCVEWDTPEGPYFVYAADEAEINALLDRFWNDPVEQQHRLEGERLAAYEALKKTKDVNVALWAALGFLVFFVFVLLDKLR
jgi:hypothetical protein